RLADLSRFKSRMTKMSQVALKSTPRSQTPTPISNRKKNKPGMGDAHSAAGPSSASTTGAGQQKSQQSKAYLPMAFLVGSSRMAAAYDKFMLIKNSPLLFVRDMRLTSSSIASTGFMSLSTLRRMYIRRSSSGSMSRSSLR